MPTIITYSPSRHTLATARTQLVTTYRIREIGKKEKCSRFNVGKTDNFSVFAVGKTEKI